MANCFLCYERNSPDIACDMIDVDHDGSITNVLIASSFDRAIEWLMSAIEDGICSGFHVESGKILSNKDYLNTTIQNGFKTGSSFSITMYDNEEKCADEDNSRWYDIVIEIKELVS